MNILTAAGEKSLTLRRCRIFLGVHLSLMLAIVSTVESRVGVELVCSPSELTPGPVILKGRIIHRAVDGAWLRFKLSSDKGLFTWRVTLAGTASAREGSPDIAMPCAPRWQDMRPSLPADPDIVFSGCLKEIKRAEREMAGCFNLGGKMVGLRFVEVEHCFYDEEPPPDLVDIKYGRYPRQTLDVYFSKAPGRTPAVIYIHGGAWIKGDKRDIHEYGEIIRSGITVISINYRFCPPSNPAAATPPVAYPMHDAAQALQFVRSKADEWNIDPCNVGLWGRSAGACTALWLATHPDLADASSPEMIPRQSTRPACVAAIFAQTTLDPLQMRAWVGRELTYGPHAFGISTGGLSAIERFDRFIAERMALLPLIEEFSPASLIGAHAPPIYLDYLDFTMEPSEPLDAYYVHSPRFGQGLAELAKTAGVECHLRHADKTDADYSEWKEFLIQKLKRM
jgi:acetyl esterase/lipase